MILRTGSAGGAPDTPRGWSIRQEGAGAPWPWGGRRGPAASARLCRQALGVGSSQDRAMLKRKLKELSLAVEKERKAQEKAKQREKQKKKDQEQRRS